MVYLASLARRPTQALFIYLFKFHVIIRKNYTAARGTGAVIVLWFELQVISVVWRAHTKLDIRCIEIGEWYFRGESSIGYYLHHDVLIIQLELSLSNIQFGEKCYKICQKLEAGADTRSR